MMNMLASRLLNAVLIAVAVLSPTAVFAQDASTITSTMMDNSSPAIGGLVIWLLPIGGIFAVAVATAMDKGAQASRTTLRR